jgi:glycosyltransferase involved in cell wall biosynthesis
VAVSHHKFIESQILGVTTVTPVYAGRDYLPELIEKLEKVRESWQTAGCPMRLIESIFVDDGSRDGSAEVLEQVLDEKKWVRLVSLSRNFGQHPATVAGVLHSSGDWVITLDEDLQHDPAYMEKMLEKAATTSSDVVYVNSEKGVHQAPLRDWTSHAFKAVVAWATESRHTKIFSSFRLMRGGVGRAAGSVCTHEAYFDVVLGWFTDRMESLRIPLKDVRFVEKGQSGYTFRMLLSHGRRMVISSQTKLLRLGAVIGFLAMALAVVSGTQLFVGKLIDPDAIPVRGWTSLFLTVLFFGGLLAVLVGIVLEYIRVILLHFQGKPTFFVVDRSSDRVLVEYFTKRKSDDAPVSGQ